MVTASGGVRSDCTQVRSSSTGSFCNHAQYQAPKVLCQASLQTGRREGCSSVSLAFRVAVHLSSDANTRSGAAEDCSGKGGSRSHCSILATQTLVLGAGVHIDSTSVATSSQKRPAFPESSSALGSRLAETSRLEVERKLLVDKRYSSRVQDTILESRRASTSCIYQLTWPAFCSWTAKHDVLPASARVLEVWGFLHSGLESGLRLYTLRQQFSALSSVLDLRDSGSSSLHPHISQFLKGVSNLAPPPIHRFPTWDLNKVLNTLTKAPFEPLSSVALRYLSRVLFLVAITLTALSHFWKGSIEIE
ncbi:uncharacterized protein LOC128343007 [Hemicordylus capensis]|uniref:uncharacterized protein LOC128343007 n=1 Tax=Hemicordylus capensis TaxID=884348 RepID=UPI002302119A|nr:uncharacterized protein LOC128343007 [Hemicordylus capensis]XP_053147272.1 uncharacterized protein LOC128343007 [Hemicordylus capensis]XP_053147273.1 uncharacterized protein LOC128343007 [Hemicordylus capensis]XP_053147274.1 uncharacterized protein LOC128343007 [Hemicordylus capensis]XP_053147275.1 uncharacterized protein LOC128343007 [Hemicordylus capensis]XP_053147276.1 uncharacterized protein LOC128343007 [Hemicordylus capensis]